MNLPFEAWVELITLKSRMRTMIHITFRRPIVATITNQRYNLRDETKPFPNDWKAERTRAGMKETDRGIDTIKSVQVRWPGKIARLFLLPSYGIIRYLCIGSLRVVYDETTKKSNACRGFVFRFFFVFEKKNFFFRSNDDTCKKAAYRRVDY